MLCFSGRYARHLCLMCGKAFEEEMLLEKHMNIHTREKPFKCPLCNFWLKHKECLKDHMIKYHKNTKP